MSAESPPKKTVEEEEQEENRPGSSSSKWSNDKNPGSSSFKWSNDENPVGEKKGQSPAAVPNAATAAAAATSSSSSGGVVLDDTTKGGICICGILILSIVLVTLLAVSINKLNSTEYGIQYNKHNKRLDDDPRSGGMHFGPPGYSFIKFPSTYNTVDLPDSTCLSRDGLRVQFSVTFQYQMPKDWMYDAILKYRNFDKWSEIVIQAGDSAVQHSCSEFTVSEFQSKRGVIQGRMEEYLRLKLEGTKEDGSDGVYALAISLQLSNVDLPDAYNEAVAEKQKAAEDIILAQNQRTQERTKAQTLLLSAKEEARRINDTAINEAEVILTEAELQAEETLYAFEKEAQVLTQVKRTLGLSNAGVLAYMTNRLYAQASDLKVHASEPARLSRKNELAEQVVTITGDQQQTQQTQQTQPLVVVGTQAPASVVTSNSLNVNGNRRELLP